MTLLKSDLLATGTYTLRATGIAMTAGAIALAALPRRAPRTVRMPVPELGETIAASNAAVSAHEPEGPKSPLPVGAEAAFVFEVGGKSYLKLDDSDTDVMPAHGKARAFRDDYVDVAIATVKTGDVAEGFRGWAGREVVVDGTCRAHVSGFAIIARVNGDASWVDQTASAWTPELLFQHGHPVLAAKLDRVCRGTIARDAALPPIVYPREISAPVAEERAKQMLIASDVGAEAQRKWREEWGKSNKWWDEIAPVVTALRHPKTGVTWISVLARIDHGCGEPYVAVWGLYRLERDGTPTPIVERELDNIDDVVGLLDLDGDGNFEVIGRAWLGDRVLQSAIGAEIDRDGVQFFGCPC